MNFLDKIFSYENIEKHETILHSNKNISHKIDFEKKTTFKSLTSNIKLISAIYSQEKNSDVVIRNFILNANGKQYNSSLVFIDGLANNEIINQFVLTPLMHKNITNSENSNNIFIKESTNIHYKITKKTNIEDLIMNSLISQNSIKTETNIEKIINNINSGLTCLFIDTIETVFCIEAKGYKIREISKPENEIVVRGSQEAFVENIRTNTSMIRRIINNENLIIEQINIGKLTKTPVSFCYLKNIANEDLVNEVKFRLTNIEIDSLTSSGVLEQLIQDDSNLLYPQIFATERSDRACYNILQGRIVILVNGSPYALIVPSILIDFLSSPEDLNIKSQYGNLARIIRAIAFLVAMFLPAMYIAITNYHQEFLPTDLVFAISSMRKSIPYPIIFELFIMEISFELIREASLRVPSPIGATIGIIGGLILGEAAVSANLVSPLLIIIVAITGICSYAIPDFSLNFTLRCFRFFYTILGYAAGFLGISVGIFINLILLSNLQSFGVSYFSPYIPAGNKNTESTFLIKPAWKREQRSSFLKTKENIREPKISMKWKYKKGE